MVSIARLWADNPVLTKEMRTRMRGARAYWILTGYLAFLSLVLFSQYALWWSQAQSGGGLSAGSKIGQQFFITMIVVQAFLVLFITPAVTSGAITVEREQRTMEMLEMTRLPRSTIVAGKLLSAVGFVALLLVSSLPLTSICFVLGGVSPEQVIYWYLILLVGSLVAGSLGLMWSTIARTTTAAVLYTYVTMVVPPIAFLVFMVFMAMSGFRGNSGGALELLMTLVMTLFGIMTPEMLGSMMGPNVGPFYQAWQMRHYYGLTLPMWVAPTTTYLLIALILSAVAVARLETFPERKAPMLRLLMALFVAQQCFFLFGARFSVYYGGGGLAAWLAGAPVLTVLAYPALLLLLCVPIFSCGELRAVEARRFSAWLAWGWSPAGLKRGKMASGLPFLLGLTLVVLGAYVLSFALIGQPLGALTGQAHTIGASTPVRAPAMPAAGAAAAATSGGFLPIALVLASAVVAFWAVGASLSVMTRNRWAALIISYGVLVLVLVAPAIAQNYYAGDPQSGAPSILINLHYLNPVLSIGEATDTSGRFWSNMPLLFGTTPFWIVSTVCYMMIAGMSLVMAVPFVTRIAARPALPYEDMAAKV